MSKLSDIFTCTGGKLSDIFTGAGGKISDFVKLKNFAYTSKQRNSLTPWLQPGDE
jgi:hypothetical protein